ncbi:DNA-binding protein WhiA [Lachnospiraceae bacterium 29-84]
MSFSGQVKEELSRQFKKSRHCQIAEVAAILGFAGKIEGQNGEEALRVYTENLPLARKYFLLLKDTFQVTASIAVRQNIYLNKSRTFIVSVSEPAAVERILQAVKWRDGKKGDIRPCGVVSQRLVQSQCCRRSFLRGAFLCAGSVSDPEKSYHFEIICTTEEKAKQLIEIINSFSMDAKIVIRKKSYVVYLKEGAQIVDMLNVMGAHVALMDLENIRILKEMRNSVNRKVNCETANINKTVGAAIRQVRDIKYIIDTMGLAGLADNLQEIALLRLQYPEAALKELGEMLDPPVGKSGVNHRLRKLCEIAEELRKKDGM